MLREPSLRSRADVSPGRGASIFWVTVHSLDNKLAPASAALSALPRRGAVAPARERPPPCSPCGLSGQPEPRGGQEAASIAIEQRCISAGRGPDCRLRWFPPLSPGNGLDASVPGWRK